MLQIRLSKAPAADGPAAAADTVTVVCPDHLILADLPVAKGIGAPIVASLLKTVGRRSRRQLGERVHFCVRCDFPIAIYGRLSPCEHAFCLDCARSDSICYLCDDRIQKIQTIKLMEGIFICAAPHCLKSFLKRSDFESHIHDSHAELLQTNADKEDHNNNNNDSEAQSARQSSATESTLRAPVRPSSNTNSQIHDRDDKTRRQLAREPSLPRPVVVLPKPPPVIGHGPFQPPSFDSPIAPKHEPPGSPFPDYSVQPPSYAIPTSNAPFGYAPLFPGGDGSQAFYGAPYDTGRQDEAGSEHGSSLLGFPPGPAGSFPGNYHQPWAGAGPAGGVQDGFGNVSSSDSQGKIPFYQGEFGGRNRPMETVQGVGPRDGKGILAPPPPPPKRKFYSDMGRDSQGYGWQNEGHDGFGSGQD